MFALVVSGVCAVGEAAYREPILPVRHVITGGANQTTARVIQLMKVRLAGVGEGLAAEASPSQATTSNG
jgi:hypothetical protein